MGRIRLTGPDDPRHGTVNAYSNGLCRCDRCRLAWSDYNRSDARRAYQTRWRRARGIQPRTVGRTHGLRSTYVHGRCRCAECREAERVYRAKYRNGSRTSVTPTR